MGQRIVRNAELVIEIDEELYEKVKERAKNLNLTVEDATKIMLIQAFAESQATVNESFKDR